MNKILFVVAHPDDESLWVGGLLNFLQKSDGVEPVVVCMTGKSNKERYSDFKKVMSLLGIDKWALADNKIGGGVLLENIEESVSGCLDELNLKQEDFALTITHSYYGDEHDHPQHVQLFDHFKSQDIPFAMFSNMTLPLEMGGLLRDLRRQHNTHLLNFCQINNFPLKYYLQFKVDGEVKDKLLRQYGSINQKEHQKGYASWDSQVEGLYFKDEHSLQPFLELIQKMPIPGGPLTKL